MQLDETQFVIMFPPPTLTLSCKGKTVDEVSHNKINATLQVTIPCGCMLIAEGLKIKPSYPCQSNMPQKLTLHHLFPGAWIKSTSPIVTNQTMFNDLESIINEHWTTNVSHLTLQPVHYDPLELPILVHVSTHLSFFSSAWMIIVTLAMIWLCWRVTHLPLPPILIPVVNAATYSRNETIPSIFQTSFSLGEVFTTVLILAIALLCYIFVNHAQDMWVQKQPTSLFLRIRQKQPEIPTKNEESNKTSYKRRNRRQRRHQRRQKPYEARRRINTAVLKNLPNLLKESEEDEKSVCFEGPWCTCWSCSYRQDMGDIGPAPESCEKTFSCQCIRCHDKRVSEYNRWQYNIKKIKKDMK
jgi:hypothetical protein